MIAFAILCAVLVGFIALALYLDAIGFDPFALYGSTDPRELVERGRERGQR